MNQYLILICRFLKDPLGQPKWHDSLAHSQVKPSFDDNFGNSHLVEFAILSAVSVIEWGVHIKFSRSSQPLEKSYGDWLAFLRQ